MSRDEQLAIEPNGNAESRAELAASRARLLTAADKDRRRIRSDLHNGAQQQLVHAVMRLKLAQAPLRETPGAAVDLVEEALAHAEGAMRELRELAHGILPLALSQRGLRAGFHSLVSRMPIPVSVAATEERLPEPLEATAYFIVDEALTNTVKHAGASRAGIAAVVEGGALRLTVSDDGAGGASPEAGAGLIGLRDRAAVFNGELSIDSPPGKGTVIVAKLPIPPALEVA